MICILSKVFVLQYFLKVHNILLLNIQTVCLSKNDRATNPVPQLYVLEKLDVVAVSLQFVFQLLHEDEGDSH